MNQYRVSSLWNHNNVTLRETDYIIYGGMCCSKWYSQCLLCVEMTLGKLF